MSEPDPIEQLAVGVAADHKAKQTRAKKGGTKPAAEKAGDEAAAETTDAGAKPDLKEVVSDKVGEAIKEAIEDGAVNGAPEAAAPPPPSPGDDAETVFDRRLARLTTIVEEAEFESGTVFGDLRDCVLDLFKHRPKLWSAMSAHEQQDTIRTVEATVKQLLGRVVLVIAQEESDTIQGTLLGQFAVKGETIEAKLKIEHADSDVLVDLYGMAGHKIVLVSADDKRFMSARRDAPVEPDQLGMRFADAPREISSAAPPAPTHPADDSDLADGADGADDDVGDPAPDPKDQDDWGVFDTDRGEWLIDEGGGDDGWTTNSVDAGRWPHDKAKELATDFADGGEGVVARQLHDVQPPAEPLPGGEERTHGPESAVDD